MPKTRAQRRIENELLLENKDAFNECLFKIVSQYQKDGYRFEATIERPIRKAAEHYLTNMFVSANARARKRRRRTVKAKDIRYVLEIESNQRKLFDITKLNKIPTELLMIIKSYLL
jgi:histone H3/H4